MSITFRKRQKELKRQEKQRAKAEKREQRKAVKRAEKDAQVLPLTASGPKPKRHIIDAGGVFLATNKTVFDGAFAEQNRTKESM